MTTGKKAAAGFTLLMLLAVGIEVAWLHHERNAPGPAPPPEYGQTDPDELVFLKKERPSNMADLKDVYGRTIWVSAGGQMDYYPANGHHADLGKTAGTLLGAEPIVVKDAFEQVGSKDTTFRIPGGDKQVFLAFTMPKSADPAKPYAVPVGYKQGGDYTFFTDDIFFYDDPHELYKYWGPAVWQTIDSHQITLGMNERQVQLSLGQVSKSASTEYGNRMVVYANLGHPIAVTFVKNKATAFRENQEY